MKRVWSPQIGVVRTQNSKIGRFGGSLSIDALALPVHLGYPGLLLSAFGWFSWALFSLPLSLCDFSPGLSFGFSWGEAGGDLNLWEVCAGEEQNGKWVRGSELVGAKTRGNPTWWMERERESGVGECVPTGFCLEEAWSHTLTHTHTPSLFASPRPLCFSTF
jgi:hypothetical protein